MIAARRVLAVALASAPAAQAANDVPLRASDRAAASVDVGATGAPRTTAVASQQVASGLAAALRVGPSWTLTAQGALAVTAYRFGNTPRGAITRASNALVGARWTVLGGEDGARPELVLGLAAGAPLVTVPSGGITKSAAAEQADRVALGAAGPRGFWLWARNAVPVVGLARASRSFGALRTTLDVEPGLLLSVNRDPSRAALVVTGELSLALAVAAPYASASVVGSTRALDRGDFAQSGAAVGVRHDLGHVFGWAEARLQLDNPAGVGDPYATSWGGSLGAGARF